MKTISKKVVYTILIVFVLLCVGVIAKEYFFPSVLDKIEPDMILGEAVEVLGKDYRDNSSADTPLLYSWDIGGNRTLYILFSTDNPDFLKHYHSGAFVLPDEKVEYDSFGQRKSTQNEQNVLKEWFREHKAVYAYIVFNNSERIIFDIR